METAFQFNTPKKSLSLKGVCSVLASLAGQRCYWQSIMFIQNYGEGGLQNGRGGAREVLPLRKGGAEKVLAMLKGGQKSFGVFFTR